MNAYPLTWPIGWKRTAAGHRRAAKFSKGEYVDGSTRKRARELTVSDGVNRVLSELGRMGVPQHKSTVISTNIALRLDGLPRSGERKPQDPGAAVYWVDVWTDEPRVMAIDQYTEVADNLAAIAATLEAMRAIERHGGALILERAFTGFVALPNLAKTWRQILGFDEDQTPSVELMRERYRSRASTYHPDKGGTDEQMAEINKARVDAEKELG